MIFSKRPGNLPASKFSYGPISLGQLADRFYTYFYIGNSAEAAPRKESPDQTLAERHKLRARSSYSAATGAPDVNGTVMAVSVKDGSVLWQISVPPGFEIGGNVYFLNVYSDSSEGDIVVLPIMSFFGKPVTDSQGFIGVQGSSGKVLWKSVPIGGGSSTSAGLSLPSLDSAGRLWSSVIGIAGGYDYVSGLLWLNASNGDSHFVSTPANVTTGYNFDMKTGSDTMGYICMWAAAPPQSTSYLAAFHLPAA